jgi:hypothetical protein
MEFTYKIKTHKANQYSPQWHEIIATIKLKGRELCYLEDLLRGKGEGWDKEIKEEFIRKIEQANDELQCADLLCDADGRKTFKTT